MLYALIDSSIKVKNNALKSLIMIITIACITGTVIYSILINILSSTNNDTLSTNTVPTPNEDKTINPLNIPNTQPTIVPTKETISDIADKLNVNDNTALQDGLKQMGNIASSMNSLK